MLLAVIMGLEQPRRSVLSKRRWRRRLLLVSFCRMIVFTRNLSGGPVLEKAVTPLDAGNHEGFRVSPSFHAARADDFACLRSRFAREQETQESAAMISALPRSLSEEEFVSR